MIRYHDLAPCLGSGLPGHEFDRKHSGLGLSYR